GVGPRRDPDTNPAHGSGDLLVDPRGDDTEDDEWLGDVLERALAQRLQHEMLADALGGRGPHDDLAAGGGTGEPRGDVRRRPRRRERPTLAASAAELRGADQRLARVDAHVELDGREHAAVFFVEHPRALANREGRAGRVDGMVARSAFALEDHHEAVAGRFVHVAVVGLDDLEKAREVELDELIQLLRLELLRELRVSSDVE